MEDLFGVLCAVLIFLLSVTSKKQKTQKKNTVQMHAATHSAQQDKPRKSDPKAAAPKDGAKHVTGQETAYEKPMSSAPVHFHEGKAEVPCPAEDIRPSQKAAEKPAVPAVPGLKLSFDRNSVVQGFVMSEILNRPRPGMRR